MRWQDEAACHGQHEVFDAVEVEDGGFVYDTYPHLEKAKAICHGCPVFAECDMRGKKMRSGIWAGRPRK